MTDEVEKIVCDETEQQLVLSETKYSNPNVEKILEVAAKKNNGEVKDSGAEREKDGENEQVMETNKKCDEADKFEEATEDCKSEVRLETSSAKQGVEDSTVETTPEANESQDSLGLVIDENNDEQEVPVEKKPNEDSVPKPKDDGFSNDNQLVKTESKDSCEDISEASVVTQIDVGERTSENATENFERNSQEAATSDAADLLISNDKVPASSANITVGVIEIDDEAEYEQIPSKQQSDTDEVKGENAQYVVKEILQDCTVIEIDDEDEDEIKQGTMNEENISKSSELVTAMEVDTEPLTVKPETMCSNSDNDDKDNNIDIEMQEAATIETDVQPTEDTEQQQANFVAKVDEENALLKEAPQKSISPTPAAIDSLEKDTSDEVFYNKECINYECPKNHKQYFRAPQFAMSFFKVTKKRFKGQFICAECYDKALDMYEEFCGLLNAKQPLLLNDFVHARQEFVEIIDSSDEDDSDIRNDKDKETVPFSKKDLALIESELESSIEKVLRDVDIQSQLTWSKTMLSTRVTKLEEETNHIDVELRALQKKADDMHVSLYQCPKIKIRQLQALDLNSGRPYAATETFVPQLPPVGEIQRPPIQLNEIYYAVKNKAIASWVPCRAIEQVEGTLGAPKNLWHYKVKFLKSQYQMVKTVSAKHLAYYESPKMRLPIGTRVIAYFDATTLSRGKEKMMVQSAFYPGIVAEPLKPNNKYRYLIFYDDGYTQYVYHRDVRLVCHVSENVWEDVHPGSRDFIQKYLTQYSINRPMVQTQKGQSMTTESKGKWIYARVVDIDCSLIQMQFEGPKSHTEWIYRGSMRLGPVFKEYQKTMQKDAMPVSRLPRRAEPFIRYTEDEDTITRQQNERNAEARAVAKKSVSGRPDSAQSQLQSQSGASVPVVRHLNNSTIYVEDENKPKGKVVYYTAKRNLPPLPYKRHQCDPSCLLKITHNLNAYSPLSKPLLSGWERMILRQKIKKVVTYRVPCGKIMRNMNELHQYLRTTENVLNVDNFDFSPELNCLAEYVIESTIVHKRDISGGQEKMAIPLVNYYDNTLPPECIYAAQRIPTKGVNLNLDPEFLVGCDCDDDCSDKSKCSCWQLTYAGAKYSIPHVPIEEVGYQYKRLYEHISTGIYECNVRCKCRSSCLNRVVQQQLQMKLQVFKTSNRGWGLRCLNDIPRGSFVCIYAGHLLTEANANEDGLDADEYFAELDYIEHAEKAKEGYESDAEPPEAEEEDEDLYDPDQDDDDEFTPSKSYVKRSKRLQRSTRGSQSIDEDSQERQEINFNPNADMNENSVRESNMRKLFGKDETCYVMDAKTIGNLGRYFNHSCSPNLFVQNVFVDTHDLRFPWVAFFAQSTIRSGTELTWNYNYEVGVVPGKVLYCQCGAPNCRLRLL